MTYPPNKTKILTKVRRAVLSDHETLLQFTIDEAVEAEGKVNDISIISAAVKAALENPDDKALYFIAHSSLDESLTGATQASGHASVLKTLMGF